MSNPRFTEPKPRVRLDPSVQDRVRALVLWIDGVEIDPHRRAYDELARIADRHREENQGRTVGQVDGVGEARRLYRSFGIDPTSTRPSSEALLKRALQGKDLYHINNAVDAGNAVSLATLLPLGLYDRALIRGEVSIREGLAGEEYPGIRKGAVHLAGRLCVADDQGAFGSPTSDSFRTRVTEETGSLLVIVFAPADGGSKRLEDAHRQLESVYASFTGGRTVKSELLAS